MIGWITGEFMSRQANQYLNVTHFYTNKNTILVMKTEMIFTLFRAALGISRPDFFFNPCILSAFGPSKPPSTPPAWHPHLNPHQAKRANDDMLLVRDVDRLIASMRRQNKLGELDLLELPVWAKQLEQEGAGRQLRALETIVRELKVRYPLGQ